MEVWLSLVAWGWFAVIAALAVSLFAGGALVRVLGSPGGGGGLRLAGIGVLGVITALSLFLFVGAVIYRVSAAGEMRAFPRQGILVDVGGVDINVWCEGERADGAPTVVFIPGGYAPGLAAFPLHKIWREEGRSCLIDRAGTGWSEASPADRSVKNVVLEFEGALAGSGEDGPFVLVGHSLGGLVAVNWAARTELDIVGLVSLDPTPLEMISTSGIRQPGGWCAGSASPAAIQATLSVFGFGHMLPGLHPLNSAAYAEQMASIEEARPTLKAMLSSPQEIKTGYAHFSRMCFSGFEVIREPGALGDLPLLSIVQSLTVDDSTREAVAPWNGITDDLEWENYVLSMARATNEYPSFSSRGVVIGLPDASWGHNFPNSHPDYTIDQVRVFVANLDGWPRGVTALDGRFDGDAGATR